MRKGIATPITLVVLMVVFTSLLAATGYMALGTLRGGASERVTYQAFTVAESALEAFPLLVRCGDNLPSAYTLSVSGGPALSATYSYPNRERAVPPGGGNIRVQVEAQVGGGKATLEQTFRVGCGILGAVPAALTSRPDISVRGNAQVIGYDFAGDSGAYPVTQVLLPGAPTPLPADAFSLTVADASLIPVGSYVQIPSPVVPRAYQVTEVNGNVLTLRPLFPPGLADAILPGASVSLVPFAVRAYDPATSTLTLSDARGLLVGQTVRVAGVEATVRSVNLGTNQVRLEWRGTPPTAIPEGTPLVPQILGAASAGSISTVGAGGISHDKAEYSSLVPSDPDALFQRTFGLTKEEFLERFPPQPANTFNGTLSGWELKVVRGDLHLTGSGSICGQGILVVIGDLTVNGTCSTGFQGLVYVAGDYDQQGNSVLTGAVVVEGVAELTADLTKIAGTGQGRGKIAYDPMILLKLRLGSQGLASVRPLAGTWRRP
ncbi:MAG: hypothetical protein RQ998_07575 [Thermus sp.]|nr:hypothetical protein [Thermus sp.]